MAVGTFDSNFFCPLPQFCCPPNFKWNQEKIGIFLYKVKTDDILRVLPP